jgi:protein arginine kinase
MTDALARPWFTRAGDEGDVVVSSRVRVARNLSEHRFPGFMSSEEELEVQRTIVEAFGRLPSTFDFTILYLDDLKALDRRVLLERNIITQEFSLARGKAIAVGRGSCVTAMINEEDHLRISCIREGLALAQAFQEVDKLDSLLEDNLSYAISMEWGYLNPSLGNVGTGLRASLMLHLPALVMTGLIDKAMKAINEVGLSVKGFFAEDESSLGDMYQISNDATLGLGEKEIVEGLVSIVTPLVQYERKAREELRDRQRVELEDRVCRALGILTHCRSISSREAMEHLSSLRLGACLGLVDGVGMDTVTSLFFLSQKHHVQQLLDEGEEAGGSKAIDQARATAIRTTLAGGDKAGGYGCSKG